MAMRLLAPRPGRVAPAERAPGSNWIGGYVNYNASQESMEKIKSKPDSWVFQPLVYSPYQMRYPSSLSSIKDGGFSSQISNYQFPKNDFFIK
jgi:hypothetical protein